MCEHRSPDAADRRRRIRIAPGAAGIERLEAHFHGQAFAPHRHDTYAIGLTVSGVQRFQFRGERWHCLPGQCHILHPDETHDGGAGAGGSFGYRIVHLDPALVQQALGGRPLPFVGCPVVDPARLPAAAAGIWDLDEVIDDLARIELITAVAALLLAASGTTMRSPVLALGNLARVRDLIAAAPAGRHSMDTLERLADLDRWTLARQFRAAYGTSPTRFRTLRRLDQVRRALRDGTGLVEAALDAGFADQSHMSRQFKRAYGLTPGSWVAALG